MPCGIAGFVGLSDKKLLESMAEIQRHRGPDSTGYFLDSGVGLATDRLSIVDLVTGDQPIHNETETVWITFNGEVYNYLELRKELEKLGHRFYTNTDTEAIVHAYESWDIDCVQRLRGMFAFAIWDSVKKRLFCARDRFGKKPFYYTQKDGVFLFSSELKGILRFKELEKRIDRRALDHFFTYFYIPSPWTIFDGVYKLPPASYLVYENGGVRVGQYWDVRLEPREQDEQTATEQLYRLLSESVRLRLRSDVPVGCFLSGGIDSGVIASLMARQSPSPVKSVTIGFREDDEHVRYGRLVADYLKTDHSEHIVEAGDMEILPRLLWHFDEPFADSSFIPTFYVSEAMRKEVKVALTGDGGDELFMGYPFLRDQRIYGAYMAFPRPLRRLGLKILTRSPGGGDMKRMAGHAIEKDYDTEDSFVRRYVLRMVVFTPDGLRRLYSTDEQASHAVYPTLDFLEGFASKYPDRPLDAVNYATFRGYLSEGILTKVDRMSMAVSLEARSPFLDHLVSDYVGSLSSDLKIRDGGKYILKAMATKNGLLPRAVIQRKKVGFGPPVSRWMGKEWNEVIHQITESAFKTGMFSREYLAKLLRDSQLHSSKLFGLAVFTVWYHQYMIGDGLAPMPLRKMI